MLGKYSAGKLEEVRADGGERTNHGGLHLPPGLNLSLLVATG